MVEGKLADFAPFWWTSLILTWSCLCTVTVKNEAHAGVRAADFIGRVQGKLRDFYRIGKVLGTGKCLCCIHGAEKYS